jgi:wobble nucleotide-excising tRNase
MIQKIDIEKFGLFNDYQWKNSVGSKELFRNLNIIYGRNYSGKTTLARIFKSLQDGLIHRNYTESKFKVTFSDGKEITQDNILTLDPDFKIRVYNTDFVNENLSWLHNEDGSIKPFTILGAKNIELDKKIKFIDEQLGSVEEKKGLLFTYESETQIFDTKKEKLKQNNKSLNDKLREKAVEIKRTSTIYNYPTYQINTIKSDISKVKPESLLTDDIIFNKTKLLKDESKKDITKLIEKKPNFDKYLAEVTEIMSQEIKTTETLKHLIENAVLQEWTRKGIGLHKNIRTDCGFCGNPIPVDLWDKLDLHFNKESEELRNRIKSKVITLNKSKEAINKFVSLKKDDFYQKLHPAFEILESGWKINCESYLNSLNQLIASLELREKDIFNAAIRSDCEDPSEEILETFIKFNKLIDEHNLSSSTLKEAQEKIRLELRMSEVAEFVKNIEYEKHNKAIEVLEADIQLLNTANLLAKKKVDELLEEKRQLEAEAKDESKGAELVNQHLAHYFGHEELKLLAIGDFPDIEFKITRDTEDAKNLSEGECSLISFCYFIARMEDEMKDELNLKKMIIYIDDPISSLDSNHIFFMYSLIESIIGKPKKYGQLFISTHNLDFLKYLKKLTSPDKHQPISTVKAIDGRQHFLIERKDKSNTYIKLAPKYLKNYITEFNYLFSQIHHCANSDVETIGHTYQYNFGNNMRKFLEAYLFYKYPSHLIGLDKRLEKFFDQDSITINLINRLINEYSHLGENFERGMEPIDAEVISKIANAVLDRIKETDLDQYDALVESINE